MTSNHNFEQWVIYFIKNKSNRPSLNWQSIYELTDEEYDSIYSSIRIFQKGESSEAKHIFKQANEFLSNKQDRSYMEALTLFINEEHKHSFELKRFMGLQNIPVITKHWSDSAFRQLRRTGGLEQSISVLLTAEIIAAVYYKALREATKSDLLQQLCTQILSDEKMHIQFQSEAVSQFYQARSNYNNKIITSLKKILLSGTVLVVWFGHSKVLKKASYNFFSFHGACFKEFYTSINITNNKIRNNKLKPETADADNNLILENEVL